MYQFKNFDKFYRFLDGDLKDADLAEFDFKDTDLKKYNIEGALIKGEVLLKQGVYDDSYFNANVKMDSVMLKEFSSDDVKSNNKDIIEYGTHYLEGSYAFDNDRIKIYYISDIHLCHKIEKKFPNMATREDVYEYINEIVDNIVKSASSRGEYLLIGGDTSTKFEFAKVFYTLLAKKWIFPNHIIVILGNHEIWNVNNELNCNTLDEMVEKYRQLFKQLKIKRT